MRKFSTIKGLTLGRLRQGLAPGEAETHEKAYSSLPLPPVPPAAHPGSVDRVGEVAWILSELYQAEAEGRAYTLEDGDQLLGFLRIALKGEETEFPKMISTLSTITKKRPGREEKRALLGTDHEVIVTHRVESSILRALRNIFRETVKGFEMPEDIGPRDYPSSLVGAVALSLEETEGLFPSVKMDLAAELDVRVRAAFHAYVSASLEEAGVSREMVNKDETLRRVARKFKEEVWTPLSAMLAAKYGKSEEFLGGLRAAERMIDEGVVDGNPALLWGDSRSSWTARRVKNKFLRAMIHRREDAPHRVVALDMASESGENMEHFFSDLDQMDMYYEKGEEGGLLVRYLFEDSERREETLLGWTVVDRSQKLAVYRDERDEPDEDSHMIDPIVGVKMEFEFVDMVPNPAYDRDDVDSDEPEFLPVAVPEGTRVGSVEVRRFTSPASGQKPMATRALVGRFNSLEFLESVDFLEDFDVVEGE